MYLFKFEFVFEGEGYMLGERRREMGGCGFEKRGPRYGDFGVSFEKVFPVIFLDCLSIVIYYKQ